MVKAPLSVIVLFLYSLTSIADLPPPPDPEEACSHKKMGDRCSAFGWQGNRPIGWVRGTCQIVGSKRLCSDKTQGAPIADARGHEGHEQPAVAAKKIAPSSENTDLLAQGCSNVAEAGLFSLLSMLFGLFIALRLRKN